MATTELFTAEEQERLTSNAKVMAKREFNSWIGSFGLIVSDKEEHEQNVENAATSLVLTKAEEYRDEWLFDKMATSSQIANEHAARMNVERLLDREEVMEIIQTELSGVAQTDDQRRDVYRQMVTVLRGMGRQAQKQFDRIYPLPAFQDPDIPVTIAEEQAGFAVDEFMDYAQSQQANSLSTLVDQWINKNYTADFLMQQIVDSVDQQIAQQQALDRIIQAVGIVYPYSQVDKNYYANCASQVPYEMLLSLVRFGDARDLAAMFVEAYAPDWEERLS